jgi:hypothetical protein
MARCRRFVVFRSDEPPARRAIGHDPVSRSHPSQPIVQLVNPLDSSRAVLASPAGHALT